MFYVYLLKSKKNVKFYIGQTGNLEKRLREHNLSKVKSTKDWTPFKLIGHEIFKSQREARWREFSLKHSAFKRKKFIDKMISKPL